MSVITADQRRKIEDTLLRKAESLIRHMRTVAESEQPTSSIDAEAETMAALLKTREFPMQRATEFRETAKGLQCQAYRRSVESLLSKAEAAARLGSDQTRNELLTRAKDHFAKAIRLGADEEFRRSVERRVQVVLMTSKGVDERTKQAAKIRLAQQQTGAKPPDGIEHRAAIRYVEPVMTAVIDGVRYTTINWSLRGLLLAPYRPESGLQGGDRVRIELSCDAIPNDPPARQPARVVRVIEARQAFALAFPEISTAIIAMLRALKDAGVKPEPET